MPKNISLTRGKFTTVDDIDYEYLSQWKWHYMTVGYAARDIWIKGKNQKILMHRFIMNLSKGNPELVDHIDRNPLNNCRSNLRIADKGINAHNSKVRSDNKTGFKGVSFDKSRLKYRAYIKILGKRIELGRFSNLEDAVNAREKANAQI